MTVVGFIDNNGEPIRFEDMRAGAGDFAPLPLAMLRAFSRTYREAGHYGDGPSVSVTTLVGPPRQAKLKERHETFVDPEGGWQSFVGSLAHGLFEADNSAGDLVEQKLVVERFGIRIGGTFDLLENVVDNVYQGKDYKITSAYSVKAMAGGGLAWNGDKAEYFWQAQILKYLAEQPDVMQVVEKPVTSELLHGRVKTEKTLVEWPHRGADIGGWDIVTLARDWNQRKDGKALPSPINTFPIAPLLDNERIENYLKQRATIFLAADMCEDDELPQCTEAELWGRLPGGQGRRCSQWCEVAGVCNQNLQSLGLG